MDNSSNPPFSFQLFTCVCLHVQPIFEASSLLLCSGQRPILDLILFFNLRCSSFVNPSLFWHSLSISACQQLAVVFHRAQARVSHAGSRVRACLPGSTDSGPHTEAGAETMAPADKALFSLLQRPGLRSVSCSKDSAFFQPF